MAKTRSIDAVSTFKVSSGRLADSEETKETGNREVFVSSITDCNPCPWSARAHRFASTASQLESTVF